MLRPAPSSSPLPPLSLAFLVWGLGAALYFIGFFQRVTPAVITSELMAEFSIGAAALGNLSAFYFYSYVGMQIPTGLLVDRWGPRRVLTLGAGVAALGTAAFALSTSYAGAGIGRMLIGASVGVAFVAMLKLAAHWFAPSRFAMVSGLALLTGMLGGVGAGAPLRIAADHFGWRPVMLVGSALTALLCLLVWWLVRDDPADMGYASHAPKASTHAGTSVGASLREVLGYRNVWLMFCVAGGFSAPILVFGGLWGVPFLVTHYGVSTAHAALMTSGLLLSWGLGGPLCGALSDRIGRRKPVYAAGLATSFAGWCVIWLVPGLPLGLLYLLLFVIGVMSGAVILTFAFCKESTPLRLAGTTGGISNMGNMMGGMLLQPAVGWVLDHMWTGQFAGSVRAYDFAAYRAGFALMLVWLVAGMLMLAFTRETHCRQTS
jgi:MFS family permease